MTGKRTETFGERLRQARLDAGLTQSALVRASGIPKPTLSRYENDHVMPSLATLTRLANALDVPESALIGAKSTPEEDLLEALKERGVVLRSRADARHLADLVAEIVSRQRDVRRLG